MIDILWAFIIGSIEGVTEFLPISSTGHILLVKDFLGLTAEDGFTNLYTVIIQVAAVLAVIPLFKTRIGAMLQWKDPESKDLFFKTAIAFGITGFVGLVAKKLGLELPDSALPIAWALFIGGLLFILLEKRIDSSKAHSSITWTIVFVAALGQIIAMIFPGASRSGSTIIFMLLVGLNRERATEFSFLIGIPTMLAAGGYELYDALSSGGWGNENISFLLLSSLFSAITAFISVKWLLGYIKNHTFIGFGYYRIGLALLLFGLIFMNIL